MILLKTGILSSNVIHSADIANNVAQIGNIALDIQTNANKIDSNIVCIYHVLMIVTVCFNLNFIFPNIFHVYSYIIIMNMK